MAKHQKPVWRRARILVCVFVSSVLLALVYSPRRPLAQYTTRRSASQAPLVQTVAPITSPHAYQSSPRVAQFSFRKIFDWNNQQEQPESGPPLVSPNSAQNEFRIPLPQTPPVEIDGRNGRLSLVVRGQPLKDVLSLIAETQRLNIVCTDDLNMPVSITLRDIPLNDAITAIVSAAGCTWTNNGNIIHVSVLDSTKKLAPTVQGRVMRVVHLDFVAAVDLLEPIKTLLSPVGTCHVLTRSPIDNKRTNEALVIEDLPTYLPRIEDYIAQLDQPPRQVCIQVHVLQVELEDDLRHGINFEKLMNLEGTPISLRLQGLANVNAPQAFFAEVGPGNMSTLIEALKTTTDAKTLASPRVLALNGQTARIQVGEQLGYRVTTTTQTGTLESVEFLNVGVVLEVTPTISRDGRVLLNIQPKVSTGQVNPDTGLPEEATSEVATDVMLRSGQGIVIGGLIQETNSNVQSKLPVLGDLRWVGPLFQRKQLEKKRNEIVFFLLPRVLEDCSHCSGADALAAERAQTPLFYGPLNEYPRPWEPQLYDSRTNPRPWPTWRNGQCPADCDGNAFLPGAPQASAYIPGEAINQWQPSPTVAPWQPAPHAAELPAPVVSPPHSFHPDQSAAPALPTVPPPAPSIRDARAGAIDTNTLNATPAYSTARRVPTSLRRLPPIPEKMLR